MIEFYSFRLKNKETVYFDRLRTKKRMYGIQAFSGGGRG